MEPSDEALVAACRAGDPAAWEALIERYQRLVFSIPRRAGLDADLSAEVFQQVFTILLERLDQIEHPMHIGAWLATTARREAQRVRWRERGSAPIRAAQADDDGQDILDTALLPDEVLLRLEDQHNIRTAVAALEDRCRRLLTLLFYQPVTPLYAEIAATIGATEGSIGPTRARCLQKLRRLLDAAGFFTMYFLLALPLYYYSLAEMVAGNK